MGKRKNGGTVMAVRNLELLVLGCIILGLAVGFGLGLLV